MIDFRKILEEGSCEKNHGCNVATTCMCALAEDAIDEIGRLRAALKEIERHGQSWGGEACSRHAWLGLRPDAVKQPSGGGNDPH